MDPHNNNPDHRAGLPAGYDEEDPYAEINIDELPNWWRKNIEEFRRHDLRPYRPPRFTDDVLVPPVVQNIEHYLGKSVHIRAINPQKKNEWKITISGEIIGKIERYRHSKGYSVYNIDSESFKQLVDEHI